MSKFTPGPWMFTLEEDDRGAYCDVHDRNVRLVAHCAEEANARLIAAAPEMYDLIRKFREGTEYTGPISQSLLDAAVEARALLARIDGEPDGD